MKACNKLVIATSLLIALVVAHIAAGYDYYEYTPIDDVDITSPVFRQILFAGCDYTVTCTTSTDTDCHKEGGDIIYDDDPVTHTWSGVGTYTPSTGTSVTWTAPCNAGHHHVNVTANDSPLANDTPQYGSECVQVSDVIYVDEDATAGNDDGTTWANAFLKLEDALEAADSNCLEIWVAEGTYKPGTSRSDYYDLVEGVELYGGFDPTTGDDQWAERDWVNNQTILSGDITGSDCYSILVAIDVNTTVDGFVITKAQGSRDGDAAMVIMADGTVNVVNVNHCVFKDNYSYGEVNSGGLLIVGFNQSNFNVNMSNSMFINCDTNFYGGAIFSTGNLTGDVDVTNCVFTGCNANYGGAVHQWAGADFTLTNCTFTKNNASEDGGAIYNYGTLYVKNSILWNDTAGSSGAEIYTHSGCSTTVTYSDVQGGYSGTGNINADPNFVDDTDPNGSDNKWMTSDDGLAIDDTRAIDAANGNVDPTTDILGNSRYDDSSWSNDGTGDPNYVDMGAYEYQG
jgi:predicted outer membrane repeat protein